MKIYNKSAFAFGIFCAIGLIFFALDIISVDWWLWIIVIAVSGKHLYLGLSETANQKEDIIRQCYHETAVKLYGKFYRIKTNLPTILLIVFFVPALFIRFAFDRTTPVGIAVAFCILLTISVAYSIGIEKNIKNFILEERQESQNKQ